MSDKLLITLIQKDIRELEILTQGLEQMLSYPQILIDLSISKAQNIVDCLQKLPLPVAEKNEIEVIKEERIEHKQDSVQQEPEKKEAEEIQTPVQEPEILLVEKEPEIEIEQEEIRPEKIETIENVETPVVEEKIWIEPKDKNLPEINILNDKLTNTDNSLAGNISKHKITDIKQAISIADRFRFQRELFEGNGEKLSGALTDFNKMENFQQAQSYISTKLKWDMESEVVQEFMEILQRRLD
ncbi:MAG: hypothetical protein LBT04_00730 [Prevotellaceae bacterium]|nr:hypothetical protein [Prevotellaceae bacterium]